MPKVVMKSWEFFWKKLSAVPYGKAVVTKVDGEWTEANITRAVRADKKTGELSAPLLQVRTALDESAVAVIQETFDDILSGTLTLDKHEGRIVSYSVTETLLGL